MLFECEPRAFAFVRRKKRVDVHAGNLARDFLVISAVTQNNLLIAAVESTGLDMKAVPNQHHPAIRFEDSLKLSADFGMIEPVKSLPRDDHVDRIVSERRCLG